MVTRRLAAAAALVLAACDQFTQVDGSPLPELPRPIVVMHRGAGQGNPDYRENTLRALLYGAPIYDGVEMDLQLSADGTLWLGHDNDVYDCNVPGDAPAFYDARSGGVAGCFQEMTDAQIAQYAWCDSVTKAACASPTDATCVERYVRLEEVFDRFTTDPALLPKYLALDVKDQLCGSLGVSESRDQARALHQLLRAYPMDWRLFVESDMPTFMDEFHALGTPEYLFVEGYGPVDPIIEDAHRNHTTGISYRYTEAPLDPAFPPGLRGAGLRVMMWPVPASVDGVFQTADIPLVWAMRPDIIATDVPDFYSHVALPQPF